VQRRIALATLLAGGISVVALRHSFALGREAAEGRGTPVDATTLRHKVMCGYQGWFRCPGDGTGDGWLHWSRDQDRLTAGSVTFEMWPDLAGFTAGEKFPVPGFSHPDGSQAYLFSSAHPLTVQRHFDWMQQAGIDGIYLQRFLVNLRMKSFDTVLANVRASAAKTGRAYALCYDLSGYRKERIYDTLVHDWQRLVDEFKVTQDERYLHHRGKPVLVVWGLFSDRFEPELAHRILDFFQADERYGVTLVGGCQWYWRTEKNAEWARAFRRLNVISPWNVGNYMTVAGQREAETNYWRDDLAAAKRAGAEYMPVIYPGFAWTNLQGKGSERVTAKRLGGEFYSRQFATVRELGIEQAYVAMFDEVDEATAILPVSNSPPTQAHFATYEDLPTDRYLQLTAAGAKLLRGE
jgi:hypothetical protein